jgi:hypothetical protein
MVVFTPRPQRSGDLFSQAVGVFEDDALLLRMASRSCLAEPAVPRASVQMTPDDLAFEVARLADSATWDL